MINSPAFAHLSHPVGGHLLPLDLAISAHYQPYVTAGAVAACDLVSSITCVRLQDHMEQVFSALSALMASHKQAFGTMPGASPHHFADAYLAGYRGRLQQDLMLLHPNTLPGRESLKG